MKSNTNLRGLIDTVTSPRIHSYSVRDIGADKVLGIYSTELAATEAGMAAATPGRSVEIVVWHPKDCRCPEAP